MYLQAKKNEKVKEVDWKQPEISIKGATVSWKGSVYILWINLLVGEY